MHSSPTPRFHVAMFLLLLTAGGMFASAILLSGLGRELSFAVAGLLGGAVVTATLVESLLSSQRRHEWSAVQNENGRTILRSIERLALAYYRALRMSEPGILEDLRFGKLANGVNQIRSFVENHLEELGSDPDATRASSRLLHQGVLPSVDSLTGLLMDRTIQFGDRELATALGGLARAERHWTIRLAWIDAGRERPDAGWRDASDLLAAASLVLDTLDTRGQEVAHRTTESADPQDWSHEPLIDAEPGARRPWFVTNAGALLIGGVGELHQDVLTRHGVTHDDMAGWGEIRSGRATQYGGGRGWWEAEAQAGYDRAHRTNNEGGQDA